jgi:hypothetical protein
MYLTSEDSMDAQQELQAEQDQIRVQLAELAAQAPMIVGKTWLLFPFMTNQAGWDSAITIANVSLAPFESKPQQGNAWLYFYGDNAPTEHLKTPPILPGTVYATTVSAVAPNFQGYIIARCNFIPARGVALIGRLGSFDSSPYVAEVIRVDLP